MEVKVTEVVYIIQEPCNKVKKQKKIVQVNVMNQWRMNQVIQKNKTKKQHQTIIMMTGMMRIIKIKNQTRMMKSPILIKNFMIGGKKSKKLRTNKKMVSL